MTTNTKYLGYIVILIVLALVLWLLFANSISLQSSSQTTMSLQNTMNDSRVQIVVARYEEKLDWIAQLVQKGARVTCYNKGKSAIDINGVQVKTLKNVGREGQSYLTYLIENYDNLPEITIFLPGSCMDPHKRSRAFKTIQLAYQTKKTVMLGDKISSLKAKFKDFQIDSWKSTNVQNASKNSENALVPSSIRPFGKWMDHYCSGLDAQLVAWNGIFAISKHDILKRSRLFYQQLLSTLDKCTNPEAGHYMERAWTAIFLG